MSMKQKIKLTILQEQVLSHYKTTNICSTTELRRIIAILLVDQRAEPELILNLTNYNKKYAFELRKKYLKKGIVAIKDRPKKEPNALLTKNQRNEVIKTITTSSPRIFGYNEDYWNPYMLATVIREQYNVKYKSKTSLHLFFKEAKFTYHKPDKQYKNRNQQDIIDWCKNNKPIVEEALADEKNVVLVEDEMMLSTQTTTQKIWFPQGEFPKIDVSSKRAIRCVYGFLNVKSGKEHAFKTLRANSKESCNVLDKIGNIYKDKKIFLIWDNASWHKSEEIKNFLRTTKHSFHLINFPPYAPELNPQEHVWKAGRAQVTHNNFISDIDKASNQFLHYLNNTVFDYKFL
jgi:transposase